MFEYAYVHIPFCAQKCKYCAFTSFVNLSLVEKYIDALCFEVQNLSDKTYKKTIYFGGGTPSLLDISQIERILKEFNFDKNTEITFEMNPENAETPYLRELRALGINRLSLGLQTFDNETLSFIGRKNTKNGNIRAVENAFAVGFDNISVDIMYGLPEQTLNNLLHDLDFIKKLPIKHVSTYGLKIEEKTYFNKFPPKALPDEDIQAKMYLEIIKALDNFYHYEISNFALSKEYVSKHNLNYWNMNPYSAFGVSASGFDGKVRYKNTENIKKYLENPLLKEETVEADLLEETIFLGFRRFDGISALDINEKFGIDFEKKYGKILDKYQKTGHILKENGRYKLSAEGILISNYILCDFLC